MNSNHNSSPRVINVDKNAVITPWQLTHSLKTKRFGETTELRRVKYLNNIVELFASVHQTIGQSRDGVWLVQYREADPIEGTRR